MQYLSSSPQVTEQSQSKSASGTTCKNPETKWAMKLDLSQRKIWAIHLRCLCFGNLWKNVCCSIIKTMEILDKEKKRHCQESSVHSFQTTKHEDVILWKYNMLPAAGVSNTQSHSCQPQLGPRNVVQESLEQHNCPALAHGHIRAQEPNSTSLRPVVQGWDSLVCQRKPATSYSHTAISPPSFPAFPLLKGPVTMGLPVTWDRPSTSPQSRAQRATNPLGSRAFPCGEKGQEEALGASGEGAEGKPLCTLCVAHSSHRSLWLPQTLRQRIMEWFGW